MLASWCSELMLLLRRLVKWWKMRWLHKGENERKTTLQWMMTTLTNWWLLWKYYWLGEAQFSAALRIRGSPLLVHERDPRIFDHQGGPLKTCISIWCRFPMGPCTMSIDLHYIKNKFSIFTFMFLCSWSFHNCQKPPFFGLFWGNHEYFALFVNAQDSFDQQAFSHGMSKQQHLHWTFSNWLQKFEWNRFLLQV